MGDCHITHHRLFRGGPEGRVDVGLQRRPTASLPCLPMPAAQSHDCEGRWQTTVHLDASCGLHILPSGKSWGGLPAPPLGGTLPFHPATSQEPAGSHSLIPALTDTGTQGHGTAVGVPPP